MGKGLPWTVASRRGPLAQTTCPGCVLMKLPARFLGVLLILAGLLLAGCASSHLWGSAGTGRKPQLGGSISLPVDKK